jgi:hypothetical protein
MYLIFPFGCTGRSTGDIVVRSAATTLGTKLLLLHCRYTAAAVTCLLQTMVQLLHAGLLCHTCQVASSHDALAASISYLRKAPTVMCGGSASGQGYVYPQSSEHLQPFVWPRRDTGTEFKLDNEGYQH